MHRTMETCSPFHDVILPCDLQQAQCTLQQILQEITQHSASTEYDILGEAIPVHLDQVAVVRAGRQQMHAKRFCRRRDDLRAMSDRCPRMFHCSCAVLRLTQTSSRQQELVRSHAGLTAFAGSHISVFTQT